MQVSSWQEGAGGGTSTPWLVRRHAAPRQSVADNGKEEVGTANCAGTTATSPPQALRLGRGAHGSSARGAWGVDGEGAWDSEGGTGRDDDKDGDEEGGGNGGVSEKGEGVKMAEDVEARDVVGRRERGGGGGQGGPGGRRGWGRCGGVGGSLLMGRLRPR